MRNAPKHLTNIDYLRLLTIIAQSPDPISSSKIVKKMGGDKYVYERLKILTGMPEKFHNSVKFEKANIRDHPEYRKELIRKIEASTPGPTYLEVEDALDSKARTYHLNFRGFLLYLYLEFNVRRPDKRRIHNVLENPKIIQLAPFLEYWSRFEQTGFDVILTLRQIGEEYHNQLYHDLAYLFQKVTHEYLLNVRRYYEVIGEDPFDMEPSEVFGKYQLKMLDLLEGGLKQEILEIAQAKQLISQQERNLLEGDFYPV